MNIEKKSVYEFWERQSCGEDIYLKGRNKEDYIIESEIRYKLQPYTLNFVDFDSYKGKNVLEIGVGLGSDHQKFVEAGAILSGIDLTDRAIKHAKRRLELFNLDSNLQVADAENLPFDNESFDLVYSWGVLQHTPNTAKAIDEVFRVLKTSGEAKIMLYNKYSFVGYMLWIRYALLSLKIFTPLEQIYSSYLQGPGTKAYSVAEARQLFERFKEVKIQIVLSHGDLLSPFVGNRHKGIILSIAKLLWPRWIVRTFFSNHGLFMLIKGTK